MAGCRRNAAGAAQPGTSCQSEAWMPRLQYNSASMKCKARRVVCMQPARARHTAPSPLPPPLPANASCFFAAGGSPAAPPPPWPPAPPLPLPARRSIAPSSTPAASIGCMLPPPMPDMGWLLPPDASPPASAASWLLLPPGNCRLRAAVWAGEGAAGQRQPFPTLPQHQRQHGKAAAAVRTTAPTPPCTTLCLNAPPSCTQAAALPAPFPPYQRPSA